MKLPLNTACAWAANVIELVLEGNGTQTVLFHFTEEQLREVVQKLRERAAK